MDQSYLEMFLKFSMNTGTVCVNERKDGIYVRTVLEILVAKTFDFSHLSEDFRL
jgi:hypothetical protein